MSTGFAEMRSFRFGAKKDGAWHLYSFGFALFYGRRHHRYGAGLKSGVAAEVIATPCHAIGTALF